MNVRHKNVCECYETGNWIPLNSNRLLLELAIRPLTMLSPVFVFSIFFSVYCVNACVFDSMSHGNSKLSADRKFIAYANLSAFVNWSDLAVYLLTHYIKLPGFCVEALYLNVCRSFYAHIFSCSPIAHWWCQTTQIFYDYYSLLFFMFLFFCTHSIANAWAAAI